LDFEDIDQAEDVLPGHPPRHAGEKSANQHRYAYEPSASRHDVEKGLTGLHEDRASQSESHQGDQNRKRGEGCLKQKVGLSFSRGLMGSVVGHVPLQPRIRSNVRVPVIFQCPALQFKRVS
jgi:hypothetical protein